jgi:hypothetical protein
VASGRQGTVGRMKKIEVWHVWIERENGTVRFVDSGETSRTKYSHPRCL